MKPCAKPIDWETLTAYWLGELPAGEQDGVEAHYFGCAHCAARLERLAALAQGIRAAVREGRIAFGLTPRFLERLKREGVRIREYAMAPGGSVDCTITAEDDAVVTHFKAPLAGVKRVDALGTREVGGRTERWRVEDVTFDAAAGEVLLAPSAAALRKPPAFTERVQLLAVDEAGERSLGEYTFRHTPG
ncbi:MAG: anti-sigma factor [Burkholderiales bacterium]